MRESGPCKHSFVCPEDCEPGGSGHFTGSYTIQTWYLRLKVCHVTSERLFIMTVCFFWRNSKPCDHDLCMICSWPSKKSWPWSWCRLISPRNTGLKHVYLALINAAFRYYTAGDVVKTLSKDQIQKLCRSTQICRQKSGCRDRVLPFIM